MQECLVWFRSVQSLSHVWLFATPWTTAQQASLSITNSWSLPKLMSIELVMPSNHLILCLPLLLLPPIPPSIRVFFNQSTLHMRWPKYWNFSFNISPSNEHPGPQLKRYLSTHEDIRGEEQCMEGNIYRNEWNKEVEKRKCQYFKVRWWWNVVIWMRWW